MNNSAVVLFSGGQDSTTCLVWAKNRFERVIALSFDYGQRHQVELECASRICAKLKVEQKNLPLPSLSALGANALVDHQMAVEAKQEVGSLPSTFVPGRNALFLTLAAAVAYQNNIHNLVIGACETDYSGYPDCRRVFLDAMENSLTLAIDWKINVLSPLMHLSKAETFDLAHNEGVLELILEETHTCYMGDRRQRFAWGYGCGSCPACELRKNGYQKFLNVKESELFING